MKNNPSTRKINSTYEKKYLSIAKKIVLEKLKNYPCNVFLFGSRANSTFRFGSDIDVGINGLDRNTFNKIKSRILMELDESIIPFEIDIVNFDILESSFKKEVLKNKILQWKTN